ncbi:MAG TPA: hypothetical protein VGQ09_21200 [Chitinophagaceae bacterium]|jgi:hypothetical protein|nr:hypothetical protein [Chitinophagaceae bacterium]
MRLTDQQKKTPKKIIEGFFSDIDLDEARNIIADCLEVALTTENDCFDTAKERYWVFYFSKRLEELIEAAYLINQQGKSKKRAK